MFNRSAKVSFPLFKGDIILNKLGCKNLILAPKVEISLGEIKAIFFNYSVYSAYIYLGFDKKDEPQFEQFVWAWWRAEVSPPAKNIKAFWSENKALEIELLDKNKAYLIIIYDVSSRSLFKQCSFHLFVTYEKSNPYLNCGVNILLKDISIAFE